MSESTRGIIYRVLTIVFLALVIFGVISSDDANQALVVLASVLGVASNGLAWRNTTVARRKDVG